MPISHKHTPFEYSDYISALPADELIRVGTIKQQLYNEGVAKVQNQIDTLDQYGLSILKDQDKNYFSQEMDKVMRAINEGAGKTDFSNINSLKDLLSVGRPLERDPLIMNALQSTQEAQRRQQVLSSLDSTERGPANDYYFMQDYYDYLNDGKVGSKLSAGKEYIPYVDPTEYMSDILEKVQGDIRTEVIRKNGLLTEKEIEELTSQELKQWMETSLPANIKQQIQLDAMYTTKDIPQEQMLDQYMKTRQNQYQQTVGMLQQYQEMLPYLDEAGIKDYKSLLRKAQVLQDNIVNAPSNPEEAYNAWVNDYYNSYLTGQSDFYAKKKEKSKTQADPFSLASYESNLRRQENFYKEITLEEEKMKRGIYEPTGTPEEKERALALNAMFPKFTNSNTTSTKWEKLAANLLSEDEAKVLKQALKGALLKYSQNAGSQVDPDNIPSDIDLANVEVKMNSDGTYMYRVDTGVDPGWLWGSGTVKYDIYQDKFDEALREDQGLENYDFQDSVDTRYQRPKGAVDAQGNPTKSQYVIETPTLDSASIYEKHKSEIAPVNSALDKLNLPK